MTDWIYIPEFVRDGEQIKRVGPPIHRHSSGREIDISRTTCLAADMLDIEGKHDEAADARRIASGDAQVNRRQVEYDEEHGR